MCCDVRSERIQRVSHLESIASSSTFKSRIPGILVLLSPQKPQTRLTFVMSIKAVLFLGAPWGGDEALFTWGPSICNTNTWDCKHTINHPVHAHEIYCLAFQAVLNIALQASCRNICCNAGFVYSLSPAGKGVIYAKKEAQFTWFSLVVAFSLGILLPAVTAGFFPLTTGIAAPLTNCALCSAR